MKRLLICFILLVLTNTGLISCGKIQSVIGDRILTSISISPGSATMQTGETKTFTAIGYDQKGLVMTISPVWSISGGIGIIGNTGIFTAKSVGSGTIIATYENIIGQASVIVNQGPPADLYSIEIIPTSATLKVGDSQLFTAYGFDKNHNPVSFTPTWTATGGGSIDPSGRFTALIPGSGKVIATAGSIRGEASILVTQDLPEI